MLTPTAEQMLRLHEQENKKWRNNLYLFSEITIKLKAVIAEHNMHTVLWPNGMTLFYCIKKEDERTLSNIAWSLFEQVDEILKLKDVQQSTWEESFQYDITGNYVKDFCTRLCINYSQSQTCTIEYREEMVKKPKVICKEG